MQTFLSICTPFLLIKLMETTSLGQKALKGGTTLNNRPIGLYVKILNFNGRFEAFSARYGMFLFYQPIQNR